MSFYDIINRCNISATCRHLRHHDMKTITSDNLMFEKKDGEKQLRYYYKGTLNYCDRQGCYLEKFDGDRMPWKITMVINGEEKDVNEPAA